LALQLVFTPGAEDSLLTLEKDKGLASRLKTVRKTLAYLEANPRRQSLNIHKYSSLAGVNSEEVFEACAQNKTPSAFRIFWHYGPDKETITIAAITQHP
jgi:hypothetical protein